MTNTNRESLNVMGFIMLYYLGNPGSLQVSFEYQKRSQTPYPTNNGEWTQARYAIGLV